MFTAGEQQQVRGLSGGHLTRERGAPSGSGAVDHTSRPHAIHQQDPHLSSTPLGGHLGPGGGAGGGGAGTGLCTERCLYRASVPEEAEEELVEEVQEEVSVQS